MAEARTQAEIIDKLFKTIKRPNGKEHSMEEVARWCARWLQERGSGGGRATFSKEYMRQLRLGIKTNPTRDHLEALAAFFEVEPVIFFPQSQRSKEIQDQLELAVAIRDAGVEALALRAVSLNPADRAKVMNYIKSLAAGPDIR